jgi:hypothetical protein
MKYIFIVLRLGKVVKLKSLFIILTLFLVGCSASQVRDVPHSYIAIQAAIITNDTNIDIVEIPTHGALGDSLAISAKGGGNTKSLRDSLINLSNNGGGVIAVTSRNADLSRAVIEGALSNGNYEYKNVTLVYAGDLANSDRLQPIVESVGIKYGFVDISKPINK